jgi:hypothetical protein
LKLPDITMVIDTREPPHTAYDFAPLGVASVRRKLDVGDYGIDGLPGFAVERKELNDAANTFIPAKNRARFIRELQRAVPLDYFAILVEATVADILAYKPPGDRGLTDAQIAARGKQILHSCLGWQIDYGVHLLFVDRDKALCRAMVVRLAQRYAKMKRLEAMGVTRERRKPRGAVSDQDKQPTLFGGAA